MRAVDMYTLKPWGLYMARPTPGRTQFHYLESWLLPSLSLRANVFHFSPGFERDQDYYLDVGEITPDDTMWRTEDHYIDLVVYEGERTELIDVDELLTAHHHGLVTSHQAERAIMRAVHAIDNLSRTGHNLHKWLSSNGMDLTWRLK